jgi:hypothetical protein
MSAVSLPGGTASHRASASGGRSARSGPMSTNRVPRRAAAAIAARSMWVLTPPAATAEFLIAIPPKASTVSVCAPICSQVTVALETGPEGPSTCGRIVSAAAPL